MPLMPRNSLHSILSRSGPEADPLMTAMANMLSRKDLDSLATNIGFHARRTRIPPTEYLIGLYAFTGKTPDYRFIRQIVSRIPVEN